MPLGIWAIGGWMWGGTDEQRSIDTIHVAHDKGITLIDTAPVYGFGKSEEIVGKAVELSDRRDKLFLPRSLFVFRPFRACLFRFLLNHRKTEVFTSLSNITIYGVFPAANTGMPVL